MFDYIKAVLMGGVMFFAFQAFKIVFYHILNVDYDLNYSMLLGRITMDVLIFFIGVVLINRRGGKIRG